MHPSLQRGNATPARLRKQRLQEPDSLDLTDYAQVDMLCVRYRGTSLIIETQPQAGHLGVGGVVTRDGEDALRQRSETLDFNR